MAGPLKRKFASTGAFLICAALFLGACSTTGKPKTGRPARVLEIEDLRRIPQDLTGLAGAVGPEVSTGSPCRNQLLQEFAGSFFTPWKSSPPLADHAESKAFMARQAKGSWYGVNKRKVAAKQKRELLENCDLDRFPSRDERAIAVAPGHLRGLPTVLPFYERLSDEPFDMLSYPHVKLNEPLRILHASKDGVWFFVETAYSNGWLQASEVALVNADFIEFWMRAPHLLVIVRDYAPVADGRRLGAFPAKIGTILPLSAVGGEDEGWQVLVASAGEGGRAESRSVRIPRDAAAPFPLAFEQQNISLIGNQLLGQPYGWGEVYDLRDCSALLRDFFLPFGIWLPRTSADQIASIPKRLQLAALAPQEKKELIKSRGLPLLTLLFKPGHIMLYAGLDREGEPLVFHAAWSMQVKDEESKRTRILGGSVITTLEPGKELGLVPGSSLLERVTEMGTITDRCLPRQK